VPTTHCKCCELPIEYNNSAPRHCPACEDRYPQHDEPTDRTITRLSAHVLTYRDKMNTAAVNAAKQRRAADAGYKTRDAWRRAMVETVLAHVPGPGGKCTCGGGKYPCFTRKSVEKGSPGIRKEIERFEAMSEDEFERQLYDRDYH
jgi:hypothetical protein